jgi:hypothetical protein
MTIREAIILLERKLARRRRLNARDPYPGVMKVTSIGLTFQEADALVALLRAEEMAADEWGFGVTWDLSDNDRAALKAVLADRQAWIARFNKLPEIVQRAEERGELHERAQQRRTVLP